MSQIDDLITEHCPDGVEFKRLGDIVRIKNGKDHKSLDDGKYPVYGSGGVMRYANTYAYDKPSVLIPRKGSLGNLFYVDVPFWNVDTIFYTEIDNSQILPKFLYFFLTTVGLGEMNQAGGVPSQTQSVLNELKTPVPPLEIQREIVKVLDTFTQLEAELEAELEARRRQYKYYRDALLTFGERTDADVSERARLTTLGEICKSVTSGGTPLSTRSDYYGGDIPWLRTQEVRYVDIHDTEVKITGAGLANSSAKWIPANCVIVAISGATAARSAINKIPLTTNQHCCNLEIDPDEASYRYVFHWVNKEYESLKALGQGARADLNSGIIKSYPIALPPLEEQARIVTILDKFDALVNDISAGLPAEIKARRQQYEHYRDRLLSFREAA